MSRGSAVAALTRGAAPHYDPLQPRSHAPLAGMNLDNGTCGPGGCWPNVTDDGHSVFIAVAVTTCAIALVFGGVMTFIVHRITR